MRSENESSNKVRNYAKELQLERKRNKLLQSSQERLSCNLQKARSEKNKAKRQLRCCERSRQIWKEKYKGAKKKNKTLIAQIERGDKPKWHHYGRQIILLAVMLRCTCSCSYRKIHKIMVLLNSYFDLGLVSIPCANTIQNWVSKAGLYELNNKRSIFKGMEVSIIIDECLRLGKESILLVLLCSVEKQSKCALSYGDVEVFLLRTQHSWTAEKIKNILLEQVDIVGVKIRNIISDEETKLKKTAVLLGLPHIPDISHLLSTCLKYAFAKREKYILFLKIVNKFHQKCYRHQLNWMRPSHIGIKARFMNQSGIINWGLQILEKEDKLEITPKEREELTPLLRALRSCYKMLDDFSSCLELNERIALLFKNYGLSFQTVQQARDDIAVFETNSEAKVAYISKLNSYMDKYEKVAKSGHCYNACSDVIESIFGVHKSKVTKSAPAGLSAIGLEIPLLCAKPKPNTDINQCLEEVSMSNILEWRRVQPIENHRDKRKFLLLK